MKKSIIDKNLIKGIRVMNGHNQKETAEAIGISYMSYRDKENGRVAFTDAEKIAFAKCYNLGFDEFNRAFFGGELPVR